MISYRYMVRRSGPTPFRIAPRRMIVAPSLRRLLTKRHPSPDPPRQFDPAQRSLAGGLPNPSYFPFEVRSAPWDVRGMTCGSLCLSWTGQADASVSLAHDVCTT